MCTGYLADSTELFALEDFFCNWEVNIQQCKWSTGKFFNFQGIGSYDWKLENPKPYVTQTELRDYDYYNSVVLDAQLQLEVGDWIHISPSEEGEMAFVGMISTMYYDRTSKKDCLYIQWGEREQAFRQVCNATSQRW